MISYPTRTLHVDAMEGGIIDLSVHTLSCQWVKKSEDRLVVLRSECGPEAAGSVASLIKTAPLMQSPIPINHRPCLEQLAKLLALRL